ncbi:MAG: hypothetical protein H7Z12_02270 [Rhodospirillaceae bacterium]|nr:hypothetical protein [Rhodospirillales bacterium]
MTPIAKKGHNKAVTKKEELGGFPEELKWTGLRLRPQRGKPTGQEEAITGMTPPGTFEGAFE